MSGNKMTTLIIGILLVLNSVLVWAGAWYEAAWLTWVLFIVGIVLLVMSFAGKKTMSAANSAPETPSNHDPLDNQPMM
ncbi:MAG: hypothetical protein NUV82_03280 [Candidatus Komeilibacteria bacterium]|nr:hypothetical protein [Candidatus Komeilibacteria bacterium]